LRAVRGSGGAGAERNRPLVAPPQEQHQLYTRMLSGEAQRGQYLVKQGRGLAMKV
jgi:hypothetical protein